MSFGDTPAPILVVTGPSGVGKSTISRLVAAAFHPSAHIVTDAFTPFVVNGWVDPWLPEADDQHEVLGVATTMAAIQFARGGYTTLFDGHMFPDGIEGMAELCGPRGVALHYAVLRTDLATCSARASSRGLSVDPDLFARLHARFQDMGRHEANVIDATPPPDDVAAQVLAAFHAGALVEPAPSPPRDE